ncbi:MAG: HEAT repeat domain-containing protein [Planctomycetota bacterium]|jgi:HEAT repeat protein
MKRTMHALPLLAFVLCCLACAGVEEAPESNGAEGEGDPPPKAENLLNDADRTKLYYDLDRYADQYIAERDRGNSITWTSLHASLLMPLVDKNLDELLGALAESDQKHRRVIAAKALGFGSDGKRIAPALAGVLGEDNVYLVNNAAVSLYYLAYAGTPLAPLVRLISHEDTDIRSNAAIALAVVLRGRRVGGRVPLDQDVRNASGKLIFLLSDRDDPYVRGHAAAALGAIGDPTSADDLINLLADSHSFVRIQAAGGLGEIGHEKAIPPLIEALGSAGAATTEKMIIAALARIAKVNGFPCDAEALGRDAANWRSWYVAVKRE